MKDDYEPLGTHPPILGIGFIGDDQGLDYLGSEFTGT